MEKIILDIAAALRRAAATGETFDAAQLVRLLHAYNKPLGQSEQFYTKKKLPENEGGRPRALGKLEH